MRNLLDRIGDPPRPRRRHRPGQGVRGFARRPGGGAGRLRGRPPADRRALPGGGHRLRPVLRVGQPLPRVRPRAVRLQPPDPQRPDRPFEPDRPRPRPRQPGRPPLLGRGGGPHRGAAPAAHAAAAGGGLRTAQPGGGGRRDARRGGGRAGRRGARRAVERRSHRGLGQGGRPGPRGGRPPGATADARRPAGGDPAARAGPRPAVAGGGMAAAGAVGAALHEPFPPAGGDGRRRPGGGARRPCRGRGPGGRGRRRRPAPRYGGRVSPGVVPVAAHQPGRPGPGRLPARGAGRGAGELARRPAAGPAVALARRLAEAGADLIDVAAGHTVPDAAADYRRLFNAGLADRVRNEAGVVVVVGGHITRLDEVNTLLAAGRADLCRLGPSLYLRGTPPYPRAERGAPP